MAIEKRMRRVLSQNTDFTNSIIIPEREAKQECADGPTAASGLLAFERIWSSTLLIVLRMPQQDRKDQNRDEVARIKEEVQLTRHTRIRTIT